MFSFDYSDFPQQQTLLPNFHSPPYTSFSHERNPFQFHHQTLNLPHQMGIFLPPQTLHQDPNGFAAPKADGDASLIPNSSPLYEFTCNQGSLGVFSAVKKDRHSKISTAHGVRDRRVRLSMAIAREFFDLQDMLGFDKASKTIGWLLAKSKGAIKELALAKQGSDPDLSRSDSSSSSHHEDHTFANSSTDTVTRMGTRRKRSVSSTPDVDRRRSRKSASASKDENEKVSNFENQANFIAARENRARARARARERTREKLSAVLVKSIEFEDHTTRPSHLLTDSKAQSLSRPLHDQNVIRSCHSPPLLSRSGYLQSILSAPTGDQDGSVRANYLPNLIMGTNNSESAICSSFSGWNIFSFPSEMHMTSKPWETWESQAQQQYNQLHQGELR